MPYIPDPTRATTRDLSGHNLNINWDIPSSEDAFFLDFLNGNTAATSSPPAGSNVVFDTTTSNAATPDLANFLDFGFDLSALSMPSTPSMPSFDSLSMPSLSNPFSSLSSTIMDSTTTTIILDDAGNIITQTNETVMIPDGAGDVVVLETQTLEFDSIKPSSGDEEALMKELEAMLAAIEGGDDAGMVMAGGLGLGPVMVGGDAEEMVKIFEVEGQTVEVQGRGGFDGYDAVIAIAVQVMFLVAIWGVVMGIRNQMVRYRGYERFVEVSEGVVVAYPGAGYKDEDEGKAEGRKGGKWAKGEVGSEEEKVCLNV